MRICTHQTGSRCGCTSSSHLLQTALSVRHGPAAFSTGSHVSSTPGCCTVADLLLTGLANLQYKMYIPLGSRITLIVCNTLTVLHALCLMGVAFRTLTTSDITTDGRDYAIVFAVEVPVYAVLGTLNIVHLVNPDLRSRMHQWLVEHQVRH